MGRLKQRWRAGRLWRCLASNSNSEVLMFTIAGLPEPRITGTTIAHLLWASSAATASWAPPPPTKEPWRGSHGHCTREETGSSLEVPQGQRRLDSRTLLQSPGDSPVPADISPGKRRATEALYRDLHFSLIILTAVWRMNWKERVWRLGDEI